MRPKKRIYLFADTLPRLQELRFLLHTRLHVTVTGSASQAEAKQALAWARTDLVSAPDCVVVVRSPRSGAVLKAAGSLPTLEVLGAQDLPRSKANRVAYNAQRVEMLETIKGLMARKRGPKKRVALPVAA